MSDFHPEFFGGNEDAARLIEQLCFVAHVWDDLIDKDKDVPGDLINRAFEIALVNLPKNRFYTEFQDALTPLIYVGVLGYITANRMEKTADPHGLEIAHGLRYAVAHVAAFAVSITNPQDKVPEILEKAWKVWMPERMNDYVKEHEHA